MTMTQDSGLNKWRSQPTELLSSVMDDDRETKSEDREMENLCKQQDNGSIEEQDIDFVIAWEEKPSDPDWSQNRLI